MGTAERTAATLLDAYRPADDTEAADVAKLVELIKTADDPWSRALPLHLTSSALVVHPASCRVLLRWHEKMGGWLQIGGHGDPGETDPFDVVLREGREETNLADLRPWPTAELTHVVVVPVPESPKEPAHDHADLRFVLATDTPEQARPEKPTAPLKWLTLPEALELVAEDNLRETLSRVERLF
ncbi:NUDIX hydrolase [Lentzea nigeriaca]|uniref:NUDIX hydrolase n=1 Tax=Lentzea nigeriaca TaxID=1128665 RepID=UPI001EF935E2|nr:NUDIX domain-containing protein [Lentzea nigeriaca]MBM7856466.1 8-oxo-dGTP pyrophosphatase MutT (NUDIX family) [Lentzea nigeriaca]